MMTLVRPRRAQLRALAIWGLVIAAAAIAYYFRFDWNVDGGYYAKRGFVLSLYLLALTLPTVFYLTRRALHSDRVAMAVTALVFVVFAVPWRLVHLDRVYYYATRPRAFDVATFPTPFDPGFKLVDWGQPRLDFLPGGALLQFPLEWLFVPLVFAMCAGLVWLIWWLRARVGLRCPRRIPMLLTLAAATICVQMFLHAGMRAPYTYISDFVEPQSAHHWYLDYQFANHTGATQGDENAFAPLEYWFQGAPLGGFDELARRPFSFFVASQFSYYVNDVYVWLALNCLFWLAAVFATARLVTRLATPRAGLIAGGLTVFGPGFVAFVSQTSMYMQNAATAAIALCAFEDLVVNPADGGPRRYALFGGILAICGLVYDLEPVFVALLIYGLARRIDWRPLVATIVGAYAIVEGFTPMVTKVLGIKIASLNGAQISDGLHATLHLLTHPSMTRWYDTFVSVVTSFFEMWLQAFFVVPAILALLGFRLLRDRPQKILVASLFVLYLLTIATLQIGRTSVGYTPRLIYPSLIGVYLPAAVFLDRVAARADGFRFTTDALLTAQGALRTLQLATPWLVLALMAVLVNVDIFGYPTLYVEFFGSTPPVWLPH
jgi:hypothetical protein